jgi:hypothetical protein
MKCSQVPQRYEHRLSFGAFAAENLIGVIGGQLILPSPDRANFLPLPNLYFPVFFRQINHVPQIGPGQFLIWKYETKSDLDNVCPNLGEGSDIGFGFHQTDLLMADGPRFTRYRSGHLGGGDLCDTS